MLANAPPLPANARYLWEYFVDLRNTAGVSTVDRVTAQSIRDWCWLTGRRLSLWERKTLQSLDIAWTTEARRGC